jgi:hypothetical protein
VGHLCPVCFNCYRDSTQLILCRKGCLGYTLLSSEGVTQGNLLLMVLHGLTLVPLAKTLWQQHLAMIQAFQANNGLLKGRTLQAATAMAMLHCLGPKQGYFLNWPRASSYASQKIDQGPRSDLNLHCIMR